MKLHLPFFLASLGFSGALFAQAPAPAPAAPPASPIVASDQNYKPRQAYQVYYGDYLALKKGTNPDLVFIGDSITEQWRWGPGTEVWKKHFEARALNFGLGSDRTQHTIWRLQNLDVKAFKPKVAVIHIGTNNNADTAEDITAGVKAVIAATRTTFPGVKVLLISILPNARATEKMAAANVLLRALADDKDVFYVDVASKFTPEGDNWKGLVRDKLHLSQEGYEIWTAEIMPLIAKLTGK